MLRSRRHVRTLVLELILATGAALAAAHDPTDNPAWKTLGTAGATPKVTMQYHTV